MPLNYINLKYKHLKGVGCNLTHPKQEAEEEKEISDPGVDEGERLIPVQVQLPVHRVCRFRTGPGSTPARTERHVSMAQSRCPPPSHPHRRAGETQNHPCWHAGQITLKQLRLSAAERPRSAAVLSACCQIACLNSVHRPMCLSLCVTSKSLHPAGRTGQHFELIYSSLF